MTVCPFTSAPLSLPVSHQTSLFTNKDFLFYLMNYLEERLGDGGKELCHDIDVAGTRRNRIESQ